MTAPTVARTVTGAAASPTDAPARSRSTCTSTTPRDPSTVTTGRTDASRTDDHDSSVTGLQMPEVAVSSPQSQPKLHAILRIAL